METKNDVLCFLSEINFGVKVNDSDDVFEKLSYVKRRLVTEIENYNIPRLIKVLNIVDDKNLLIMTGNKKENFLEKTQSFRKNIFYLTSIK